MLQFLKCLNYAFEVGKLSTSQRQKVITLIEKKGKDKRYQGRSGTCKNCVTYVSQNGGFRKKNLSQVCHKILAILSG